MALESFYTVVPPSSRGGEVGVNTTSDTKAYHGPDVVPEGGGDCADIHRHQVSNTPSEARKISFKPQLQVTQKCVLPERKQSVTVVFSSSL